MNLKELKNRHQALKNIVRQAYKNYVPDLRLRLYKKEKLRIKMLLDKENKTTHWIIKKPALPVFLYEKLTYCIESLFNILNIWVKIFIYQFI